jgi:hypothetical protein
VPVPTRHHPHHYYHRVTNHQKSNGHESGGNSNDTSSNTNQLPSALPMSDLRDFWPFRVPAIPPLSVSLDTSHDRGIVSNIGRQKADHLKSVLLQRTPHQPLRALIRHSTAMNEELEAIATISLLYTPSTPYEADGIVVSINADSARITHSFTPSRVANPPYTGFHDKPALSFTS